MIKDADRTVTDSTVESSMRPMNQQVENWFWWFKIKLVCSSVELVCSLVAWLGIKLSLL